MSPQTSDEPASCLRPDGAEAELEPLQDRRDFELRVRDLLSHISFDLRMVDSADPAVREAGGKYLARFRAELDQLTLMRSAQILDGAEQRRKAAMTAFAKAGRERMDERRIPAEIVLDADERRGD